MRLKLSLFTLLIVISSCRSKPTTIELCEKITLHSTQKIELTDAEKKLVCGDKDVPAYKVIPAYQARFSFDGFLQSRGFIRPEYRYENDHLHVYTGEKSYLDSVEVHSNDPLYSNLVQKEIRRRFKKDELTPKLLDQLEKHAKSILRDQSFACAKVTSTVETDSGKVILHLSDLERFKFGQVKKEPISGVDERALARFYPFQSDYDFKESDLILAEKRFLRKGLVQATFFEEKCDLKNNSFSLAQNFIPGPPRTIRFGVGASTEVGPMTRAKWTNQRFGNMASLLEARAEASFKNQMLKLLAENYLWPDHARKSLVSIFTIERNSQTTFREVNASINPNLQWTRDSRSRFWLWSIGPSFMYGNYKTDEISTNKSFKAAAIIGALQSETHNFEIFDIHPEAGDSYKFTFDYRHPSFGFENQLLKLDFTYLKFFWLMNLGKGSLIFGARLNPGTSWVPGNIKRESLPPSVKFYGGGSDDLRGFKLNTLPDGSGFGALTKMGAKFELRRTRFLAEKVESFTFLDLSYFGQRPFKVDPVFYYSPGVGIRWISPIGLVQSFLARGYNSSVNNSIDTGLFFYLGLGGTF